MSVQDNIAFPANDPSTAGAGSSFMRHLLVVSVLCFAVLFAWSSQAVNITQIVALVLVLCVGLSVRAVLRLDVVDAEGLDSHTVFADKFAGTAIISALAAISLILTSSVAGPLGGVGQFALFAVVSVSVFGVALAFEAMVAAVACFALKPVLSKSPMGAEIAVMLNLQQKYQTRLA